MKFEFKRNLVHFYTHYFFLFLGDGFSLPYMTLQMMSLGLTLSDASLVNGLGPIFGFFLTPILGYAGDKLGYKLVLIFALIGFIASTTLLNYLPVYRQHSAKIGLDKNFYNETLETFESKSIIWFGKYKDFNSSCDYEPTENIVKEIKCEDKVFNVDIEFKTEDIKTVDTTNCTDLNTQTCTYFVQEAGEKEYVICDVKFEYENGIFEQGSHSLTLWTYFTIRTLVNVFLNVLFNISDGAASTITIKENSSYAIVMFFGNIGGLFPNWVTGPIVDNLSFGTDYFDCLTDTLVSVNDFKVPFFIQDGCFAVIIILVFFFLEIEIQKPKKKLSIKDEFEWLLNPAPICFFFSKFVTGLIYGAYNTYLFVFAQDTLGASTTFLGYINFGVFFGPLLVLPFAKQIINYLGIMNTICWSMIIYIGRFVAYGLTYSSPPYPFIAYGAMEFLANLYFVAVISYSSVIAPQSLIATAISIGSVMCWIVGQGIGALLAGVLVEKYNMRVMFIVFGIAGSSFFLAYWIVYHLVIKKYEVNQNKANEKNKSGNSEKKEKENKRQNRDKDKTERS